MNEFVSEYWTWYISIPTILGIIGCYVLVLWMSTKKRTGEEIKTMGHVWDENLEELDNPLPNWWRWMVYSTLIFSAVYLVLYPGLGSFSGVLNWTSTGQYDKEVQVAKEKYGPIFARYATQDIEVISKDPDALAIGQRMFINYCSTCHGSDAGGGPGFPNLTDNSWLYGSTPQAIKTSILNGRKGVMPPMGAALGGDEGIAQVAAYVMSLSGREADPELVAAGKAKFAICAGCHMPDGKGNQALGAPNLTDDAWLYGASLGTIKKTIRDGRNGVMPAHQDFLGEDKSHLIAAYIYSLSNKP
ncbi:MAG: cytochrome-c oxidase, cbb3-type subunit III [Pseudomonadota bacterium]